MRAIKFFLTATFIALATLPVTAPQTARGQNQYVLLDPGHGGTDPGATPDDDIACNYDSEAEAVWDIADNAYDRVFSELNQEWQVRITRQEGEFVDINPRWRMANGEKLRDGRDDPIPEGGVDFFLSIHANGDANNDVHGTETIYPNSDIYPNTNTPIRDENSRIVGTILQTFYPSFTHGAWDPSSPINSAWRPKGVNADDGDPTAIGVLRFSDMPAVLLETEYITNPHACRAMDNLSYRDSAAVAIREAVGGVDPSASGDHYIDRYINSDIENFDPRWEGVTLFENKPDGDEPAKTYEVEENDVHVPSGSWLVIDRNTTAMFNEDTSLDGFGRSVRGPGADLIDVPPGGDGDGVFEDGLVVEDDIVLNYSDTYEFGGDVRIKNGANLVVESGSSMEFVPGTYLHVEEGGKIIAKGTENSPIIFTNRFEECCNYWGGIVVEGDGSKFENVFISHVHTEDNSRPPALEIRAQNVAIKDATILTNQYTAIKTKETSSGDNSSFTLRSSSIYDNEWGIDLRNTVATVRNTTIENNYDVGVHFGYGSSSPAFVGNTVRGNGLEGVQVYGGTIHKFKNNVIKNNGQYGLDIFDGAYVYMNENSQNKISNNEYHEVMLDGGSEVYLGNASIDEGGYNEVYDTDEGYGSGKRYVKNRTSWTIPAEMNDWGGPNNDPVSSAMFNGPVDYEPYVTPPLTASVNCLPPDGSGTVDCYAGATGGGGGYSYDWNIYGCDGSSTCSVSCGETNVSITVTDDLGNTASASTTTGDCADDCNNLKNKICYPSSLYASLDGGALGSEIDSLKALLSSTESSAIQGSSGRMVQSLHQLYGLALLESRVQQTRRGKLSAPTGAFSNGRSEVHSLLEGYAKDVKGGTAGFPKVRDAARQILLENMIRTRQYGRALSDAQTYAKGMSSEKGRARMHLHQATAYARQEQYDQALQAVDAAEKYWPERNYASRRMLYLRRSGDPRWREIAKEQRKQKPIGKAATNRAAQPKTERFAPDEFTLGAPHPNPVSSAATLPLALPERAHVRATVYDVLGRRIEVLADRSFAAGRPELRFSTKGLAGGLYVVRIEMTSDGERHVFTEKVTVVK